MEQMLLDRVVETDYGQFDLVWDDDGGFDGDWARFFAGQVSGLVGAADPKGVYVNLARRSGGSPVQIVLLDAPPSDDDADRAWEDVVEVSFDLPEGRQLRWSTWAAERGGTLAAVPSGSYRLRVSAKGRDQGRDGEFSDHPVDFYRLELWPAPARPDAVLRVGSADAASWHREVGQRP